MQVQRFNSLAQLAPLAKEWNTLSQGIPFRKWEWLATWWKHYSTNHELYALVVRDEQQKTVGIAPWYLDCTSGFGRTIRFLGTGETCTDYLSILAAPEHAAKVAEAIADWLIEANSGDRALNVWDMLELCSLETTDPVLKALEDRMTARGYTADRRAGLPCWRICLSDNWEEYLARLSKPRRRCLRACFNRLAEGGDCTVRTVASGKELADAWALFVDLHQRRRHSLGEPGCFASVTFTNFLAEAVEQFHDRDELDFVVVDYNGRPIAAELNFISANTTFVYQSGIEPSVLEENPGWLVNAAAIARAFQSGRKYFDLLRGDERYKSHLKAEPREMVDLRIVAPRFAAQVRHGMWRTGLTMKDWIKSGLSMAGLR